MLKMTIESDRQALDGTTNPMSAKDLLMCLKVQHSFQERIAYDAPVQVSKTELELLNKHLRNDR